MRVTAKTELKWIIVGLWVLAACAGRSTRSKGSQQTLRLSHPVRVARKPAKNDFSGWCGGWELGGDRPRRLRVPGICQVALAGSPSRTGAGGPGSLDSASLGPQTPLEGTPHTPKSAKNVCFGRFSRKIGRVASRTGTGGPGSLDSASLEPQTPWGVPPTPPKVPKMCVLADFREKLAGSPRTGPEGPESLESASLGPQTPLGVPPRQSSFFIA